MQPWVNTELWKRDLLIAANTQIIDEFFLEFAGRPLINRNIHPNLSEIEVDIILYLQNTNIFYDRTI